MSRLKEYGIYFLIALCQGILMWYFLDVDIYHPIHLKLIAQLKKFFQNIIDHALYEDYFPTSFILFLPIIVYTIKGMPWHRQLIVIAATLFFYLLINIIVL